MPLKLFKSGVQTTMGLATVVAIVMVSGVLDWGKKPAVDQRSVKKAASPENPLTVSAPAASTPVPLDAKGNSATGTVQPKFDVLRVEKDGAVVVAGNAMPNSLVDIIRPDGAIVGQTKTGSQGDFALALKNVLIPGNHVLGLRSTDADGVKLQSVQTGIIRIPENEGDVLAMVSQNGELSRILMKPVSFEPQSTPTTSREDLSSTSLSTTPKADKPSIASTGKSTLQHPVLVEAVEVDDKKVFVAGAVMQGELVRVYLDNVAIGITRGTADNRFLVSKEFDLKPGMHAVRVDVINEKTGGVRSRAEVGLQHDLPEGAFAVKTDKLVGFADNTKDQPMGVEVAGLEPNSGKTVTTDGMKPKSPSRKPRNPLVSDNFEVPLKNGAEGERGKLLYAHILNNSTIDTTNTKKSAPKYIQTGRAIIIKPGDSLWRISQLTYGDGMRYTTIFNANRDQIRDPNLIYAGQILEIPEKVIQ